MSNYLFPTRRSLSILNSLQTYSRSSAPGISVWTRDDDELPAIGAGIGNPAPAWLSLIGDDLPALNHDLHLQQVIDIR
jgi:hypothetical protein